MSHASKLANRTIRVSIVAEPIVSWGLERLVQSANPRLEVVGTCEHLADCLAILKRIGADVVLIDLDGEHATAGVAELFAQTSVKILAISGSRDVSLLDRAVLAGARGVVEKRASPSLLLKAIEKVHDGELWVDRSATSRIFLELARQSASRNSSPEQRRIATLTPRERHSIAAVASDPAAPGRLIASRLHISEHTLRNHLTSIYSKLGVPNRLALYAFAHQHGLHEAG